MLRTPPVRAVVQRVPKNVGGVRSTAGRREARKASHYMTDRECRALNRELDAALKAKEPVSDLKTLPARVRRAGFQNLCFRNFAKGAQ